MNGRFTSTQYRKRAAAAVAVATLLPNVDVFFGLLPLKWLAAIVVGVYFLVYLVAHDWLGIVLLFLNCGFGSAAVGYLRGHWEFNFNWRKLWPRKKPKLRVVPRPAEPRPERRSSPAPASSAADPEEEIDTLLDKIAKSGLQSLTTAEKARLETLRQRLMQKGS